MISGIRAFIILITILAMTGATTLVIFTTYLATSIAIWIITYHLPR